MFPFNQLRRKVSRGNRGVNRARPSSVGRRRLRLGSEPLEDRRMMSVFATDIQWTNEGDDNFEVFGDNAQAARDVVNAALAMWEKVINDFDPLVNEAENRYEIEISADDLAAPRLGQAGLDSIDGDGKPREGFLVLDVDANGGGWFMDPTPFENSEFDTLLGSSAAIATTGPASMTTDMFSVVLHEVGHQMGIKSDEDLAIWQNGFLTDTGLTDPNDSTTTLFTANMPFNPTLGLTAGGGLHTYTGASVGGLPTHPNDLMNPSIGSGARRLVSNLDASILGWAYGYSMQPPSDILNGSFLINLDANGVLTLNGDPGGSFGDDFQISRSGDNLAVQVNVTDVLVPFDQVQSIQINALNNDDDVYIQFFGGDPVPIGGITVNGGGGDDLLSFSDGTANGDSYALLGDGIFLGGSVDGIVGHNSIEKITIDAGGGADEITVTDAAAIGDAEELWIRAEGGQDTIHLSIPSNLQKVSVEGDEDQDFINVERVTGATDLNVYGGKGNDFLFVSQDAHDLDKIKGDVSIFGSEDEDQLFIYDDNDNSDNVYNLEPGVVHRNSDLSIYYGGDNPGAMEHLYLFTSQGNNDVDMTGTNAMTEVVIEAGDGDDAFGIDSNGAQHSGVVNDVKSKVTINAGGGNDALRLVDTGDSTSDMLTFTENSIGATTGDSFFGPGGSLDYTGFTTIDIDMGRPSDQILVKSTATGGTVHINGGLGSDAFRVSSLDEDEDPSGKNRIGNANSIKGHLILHGGTEGAVGNDGINTLLIDDSTDDSGDQGTVTDTEIGGASGDNLFGAGGHVTYLNFATMTIWAGKGDDFLNVQGTHEGTATTIRGNDGDDRMTVDSNGDAAGGTADKIVSSLLMQGFNGSDRVVVADSEDVSADMTTITESQVGAAESVTLFGVGGRLTYGSLEQLTINGGAGGNTYHVLATHVGTTTELNTGFGADTVRVDSIPATAGGTLEGVKSSLVINGLGGPDTLLLEDTNDATPDQFSLTDGTLSAKGSDNLFGPGGRLFYDDLEALGLVAGSGGNLIYVEGTGAATLINAGLANDLVIVDSNAAAPGGDVNGVLHPLALNGGGGVNALRMEDGDDTGGNEVTVTANTVGAAASDTYFGPGGRMAYSGFSSVGVTTGKGNDRFHVEATNPGTETTLVAGEGDNGIFIDSNGGATGGTVNGVRSLLQVVAGAGTSSLWLEDSSDVTPDFVHFMPTAARQGSVGVGDNFFDAGGSLKYDGVSVIHVQMGDTTGDTLFVVPSPTLDGTKLEIDGNNPNALPGDTLNVDLAGVAAPVHLIGDTGSGLFVSNDHATINYQEIETVNSLGQAPLEQLLGDTNGDDMVDLQDLNNVRNNFGQSGPGVQGDTDFDGDVDLNDLNNVRNGFGNSSSSPAPEELLASDQASFARRKAGNGALDLSAVDAVFARAYAPRSHAAATFLRVGRH